MKETKKIKVLYLITKSNFGGAQRYVYDLATHVPQEQFDVVVALGGEGVLIEKLEHNGIRVIHIPGLQRDISLTKELRSFWAIAKILHTEKPDVLHVNSSKAGGIGAFWGRVFRVPRVIYTAHGWAFNEERGRLGRFVVGFFHWLTILLAHTTITVSENLKAQMRWPRTKHKMVTIHNGRTPSQYLSRDAARAYCTQHEPRLQKYAHDIWSCTIAELHPIKGHEVMLEAVAKLVAEGHQLRHLILGDGEIHTQLLTQITKLKLTEHVFLLGHHDEASQYLHAFDIYVQPSHSEALAYTVIEAAQAGLPIIATKVGGIPEIIRSAQEGIRIPPNDAIALTEALKKLLTDETKRTQLAAVAKDRGADFDFSNMLSATQALYST